MPTKQIRYSVTLDGEAREYETTATNTVWNDLVARLYAAAHLFEEVGVEKTAIDVDDIAILDETTIDG